MLEIKLSILDMHGRHQAARITVARGGAHHRIKQAYYYDYQAHIDTGEYYTGVVLHSYNNGAVALAAKITRAITKQQKEAKHDKRAKIHHDSNGRGGMAATQA